jgi:hypothetical protein
MLYLVSPATNRIPTQPGDAGQTQDAAASPLQRQQPDRVPPISLVERCQHAVDGLMLFSNLAVWMKLTKGTGTVVNSST